METFNSLFMVSPLLLGVLFFVAMLAGFIDSIAGGGGLLTIPALMAAGMSPANALATNKLQACGGSISATIYFIRRKVVSLSDQKLNIAMTFVGSMSGALLVQYVQADVLRQILPILVICITAHAKLLNATSNIGGLLLFILGGKVIWATGFVMLVGQFLGARMGSRLVLSKGQKLIRPMIVIVSAVMSAKLLFDSHGQEILHWLGMN